MPPRKKRKVKSKKRVARGRKLAKRLPRDRKGRFLPAGSRNLFKRKRRSKSVPPSRKRAKRRAPIKRRKSVANMSRRRGRVTGTDHFPNFLSGSLQQLQADAFVALQTFTPIPRLKTIGQRATVMELLWIDIEKDTEQQQSQSEMVLFFSIGAIPTQIIHWNDPRVFAMFKDKGQEAIAGDEGRGLSQLEMMKRFDFQSNDGFGYLLASDTFNVSLKTENTDRANAIFWKMYYRFVDIPLAEFVGLVQSTQQS